MYQFANLVLDSDKYCQIFDDNLYDPCHSKRKSMHCPILEKICQQQEKLNCRSLPATPLLLRWTSFRIRNDRKVSSSCHAYEYCSMCVCKSKRSCLYDCLYSIYISFCARCQSVLWYSQQTISVRGLGRLRCIAAVVMGSRVYAVII